MLSWILRPARTLALAAAVITLGSTSAAQAEDLSTQLEEARKLLESNQPVEARHLLRTLHEPMAKGGVAPPEAATIMSYLSEAQEQINTMGRDDVSLAEARVALASGDIHDATRKADSVRRSRFATMTQKVEAAKLLEDAADARASLQPRVGEMLMQMEDDFMSGRLAEAKATVETIQRSDLTLKPDQKNMLDRYALHILEIEQGGSLNKPAVSMSVFGAPKAAGAALGSGASGQSSDDLARINAQALLAEAEQFVAEGRFNEARDRLRQVTGGLSRYLSTEELNRANTLLQRTNRELGLEGGGILIDVTETGQIARQQILSEVSNLLSIAEARLAADSVDDARFKAAEARFRLRDGLAQGYLTEAEVNQREEEIENLLARINSRSESIQIEQITENQADLEEKKRLEETELATKKREKINENLDRLHALQLEHKYEEALWVIDEILTLDPNNPSALLMRDILEDILVYERWEKIHKAKFKSWADEMLDIDEAMIIPDAIMDYPDDWPELSVKRGAVQAFTERPENRRVLAKLENARVPGKFNTTLENALTLVATITNLEFDYDWDSLDRIGVRRDDDIELNVRDVPARVLLDRIVDKVSPDEFDRAGWAVHDGLVVIAADKDLRRKRFVVIYDIRDLLFDIPDFSTVPSLDLDSVLQQSQQGGGGGNSGIFQDDQDGNGFDPADTQEQLDELLDIIQTNIDPLEWQDNGGNTGIVRTLKGNLVITQTARNHRQIQSLLKQLREIRNIQISVESRFLTVSEDYFEQIGLDVDVFFNAKNNQFRGVESQINDLYGGNLFTPGQELNLYPSDVVVRGSGAGRTGSYVGFIQDPADPANFTFANEGDAPFVIPAPDPLSIIPVQSGSLDLINGDGAGFEGIFDATEFANSILGANPALATAFTYLDDIQVDFLLEATQADRRSVSLQAPRLTFTNGRTANIYVVTQQAFVSDLVPVVGNSAVAFDPTLGTVSDGFTLLVQGVVSADRRYVTLAISVGIAQIEGFEATPVVALAGAGGDGGGNPISAESNIQQPILQVSQVNTGVTVPDKGTILLGGQRITQEIEVETGVPVLSKLPLINRFFSNRAETKEQRTLLILLKPTILIQSELEQEAGGTADDVLSFPFETTF